MPCDSPYWVLPKAGFEKVPVPCGRCPPCQKRKVDSWVFRLMQEEKASEFAHFVTLTYDTSSVPISPNGFMTLKKKDFQDYMKRLRKLLPGSIIKYYACGEYGSQRKRPHFHAVIFGVPDTKYFFDAWHLNGTAIGTVHVGQVSSDSVAYTIKYINKPRMKPQHSRDDRQPEFSLMSKGLGQSYLSSNVIQYHKADLSRLYAVKPSGHRVALPRYYRNKIYDTHEQRQQLSIIQNVSTQKQDDLYRQFKVVYPDGNADFQSWLDSCRLGRYHAHNNSNNLNRMDL